jgi:hypothetical protein
LNCSRARFSHVYMEREEGHMRLYMTQEPSWL